MDEKLTNTHVQQYISVSFEIYFNVWNIHNIVVLYSCYLNRLTSVKLGHCLNISLSVWKLG